MDRHSPLPRHITALYLVAVTSSLLLFVPQISMVGADIVVFSEEMHRQIEVQFRDRAALFGGVLPQEGLKGSVVYSNPANACLPVAPPPSSGSANEHWILLIRRFDCPFEIKVRMAQNANYHAAIVHNVNSTDLEPMYADHAEDILIPSVFVGEDTGLTLKRKYLYDNNYFVIINDAESFNINTHLLVPFASVVGLCFVITGAFVKGVAELVDFSFPRGNKLVKYILKQGDQPPVVKCLQDRRRQRRHRLSSSSLKKIPTEKFRRGETPYETCGICLEDYQDGEKLRLLPCSHAYHCKCVDPWLTQNRRVCPTCKRKVFAYDEREVPDSDDSDSDDHSPLLRGIGRRTQHGTFTTQPSDSLISDLLRADSVSGSYYPYQSVSTTDSAEPTVVAGSSGTKHENRPGEECSDAVDKWRQLMSNRSSGEHSINSRPSDLDYSGEHSDGLEVYGSSVTLLDSQSEFEAAEDGANNSCDDVPQVEVRTGTQSRSSKPDKKANVV